MPGQRHDDQTLVAFQLEHDLLACLDLKRGDVSRSQYMRAALVKKLGDDGAKVDPKWVFARPSGRPVKPRTAEKPKPVANADRTIAAYAQVGGMKVLPEAEAVDSACPHSQKVVLPSGKTSVPNAAVPRHRVPRQALPDRVPK